MAIFEHEQQPHFVLFPFMAQGHTIPMMDIAKLLAQRGATVTLLLTPMNLARVRPALSRANNELALNIHVQELSFPAEEAGLPLGCENFDALPSNTMVMNFMVAIGLMQPQLETFLMNIHPKPSCLLADMCFTYASEVARKVGIPRILFHGMCCFALLCLHHIKTSQILDTIPSDDEESFEIPGMPDRISLIRAQVKGMVAKKSEEWIELRKKFTEDEKGAYGVVLNTFEELEPKYITNYEKVMEKKIWCVGPVSRCNKDYSDKVGRGNTASFDVNECLKWLDLHVEPAAGSGSVIYVCLGSLCNLTPGQMLELGLGLEASERPFVWVIRSGAGGASGSKKLKELMLENGFEERVKTKGLVVWGWAPQVLLLSHPAVGGFLTHCGWNSSMEGITAGLPMLTWPLFADQFLNEKLLVDVLRVGVRIGVKKMMEFGKEEEIGVLVDKDVVKKGVEELMDGGVEGEERRKRAKELADKAEKAGEEGGSSHISIGKFIDDMLSFPHL
uniref:Glycosyltransferase n=1 Tax=Kalanchoe fedtschenkoi TaxID=63787 RepID=A0A7N0VJK5_KALFE